MDGVEWKYMYFFRAPGRPYSDEVHLELYDELYERLGPGHEYGWFTLYGFYGVKLSTDEQLVMMRLMYPESEEDQAGLLRVYSKTQAGRWMNELCDFGG